MPRNVPVNLIAVVAVGVLVALIGAVTLSSSQLVNNTVAEQFRSQELQLVSSLAQQTETYFNSLNAEIGSLAQQPAINSLPATNRDAALVLLLDRSKLVVVAHRGADATGHSVSEFDLDEAHAANQVIQLGRPLVIQNTLEDERWTPIAGADNPIRSWMGIPLRVQEKTVGVLNINSHTIGRYSPEEIELAEAFADQASVALQNARLHEFEVKQIEQELTIARDIQTSLLPSAAPEIEQLEIVAYSLPARQVSGDYFQYLPMPSGQLGIAVGDVSGKGIPAAMLMAVITTAMRDEAARNARPADLLNALNGRLLERMRATHVNSALLVGIFDPPTRHLEIANGGMVQPYVRNGGAIWEFVPVGGYPLELSQRVAYDSKTITLAPGTLLLLMSDGALEAQNAAGEFFGFERLEALLNELPADIDPQALIDRILGAVGEHLGGEEAQDDITLLAIRSRDGKLKTGAGKDTSAKGEE